MKIEIPCFKTIEIKNLLFDYNGTLAKDGKIDKKTKKILQKLTKHFRVFVITADTFGSVKEELRDTDVEVLILKSKNHTKEKAGFLKKLGRKKSATIGNGNNDVLMIKKAILSISIVADEGCSSKTLISSDIVSKDIKDAMKLFLKPKRLVATLRR